MSTPAQVAVKAVIEEQRIKVARVAYELQKEIDERYAEIKKINKRIESLQDELNKLSWGDNGNPRCNHGRGDTYQDWVEELIRKYATENAEG